MGEMFIPRSEDEPSKEKYGRNVAIHAFFIRHGQKLDLPGAEEHAGLSPLGAQQAQEFGQALSPKDAIAGYSSTVDRAWETVEHAIAASSTEKKLKIRPKDELFEIVIKFSDQFREFARQTVYSHLPDNFGQLTEVEKEEARNKTRGEFANIWFAYDQTRPDAESPSPYEIASGIAYLIERYQKMAEKLQSGSDIDIINGTHAFITESFLKYALKRKIDNQEVVGFSDIEEIGGVLRPSEAVEFVIQRDDDGNQTTLVKLRNHEYLLDEDKLTELAQYHFEHFKKLGGSKATT